MQNILDDNFLKPIKFNKQPKKYKNYRIYLLAIIILLLILLINDYLLVHCFKNYTKEIIKVNNYQQNLKKDSFLFNSNIYLNDEFFDINEVQKQIYFKKINNIETLSGSGGNIGNALIILNNLINICINIKCKNIITPKGTLQYIIKKPIFNKEFNITILPYSYENKTKIDIKLGFGSIFYFKYRKKFNPIRLSIIKEEVLNNIPHYVARPNDLYINIRSGRDVFLSGNAILYSQPPLCFYQKIINENKYKNIFIVANGHENPVVDQLLKIYPNITYMHGSIVDDIKVIINAYNFIMSISTFPMTLIWLNNNLKNLYIYDMMDFNYFETIFDNFHYTNFTIYKMLPSKNYYQIMNKKWKRTKEQIDLMLTENCSNSKLILFKK